MHAEHSQHSKDEQTHFFRKIYLSHFIRKWLWKGYERVIVWEVTWKLNKDCNILTPTLLAIAAFLSHSPGQLNRGLGGPASAGSGSHSSNWNTDFKLWSSTDWLPVTPGLCNYLMSTCFLWHHISHSIQPVNSQGYPLISSTGCTCYLHSCISHLIVRPGRRSICYIRMYIYIKIHSSQNLQCPTTKLHRSQNRQHT